MLIDSRLIGSVVVLMAVSVGIVYWVQADPGRKAVDFEVPEGYEPFFEDRAFLARSNCTRRAVMRKIRFADHGWCGHTACMAEGSPSFSGLGIEGARIAEGPAGPEHPAVSFRVTGKVEEVPVTCELPEFIEPADPPEHIVLRCFRTADRGSKACMIRFTPLEEEGEGGEEEEEE